MNTQIIPSSYNRHSFRHSLSFVPPLAAARSRFGSDSHLGCHSLPKRRFATSAGRLKMKCHPERRRSRSRTFGSETEANARKRCVASGYSQGVRTRVLRHLIFCKAFVTRNVRLRKTVHLIKRRSLRAFLGAWFCFVSLALTFAELRLRSG